MRRIFSVLVDNRFGELPRIVGLCSGRGFHIEGVNAFELASAEKMRIDLAVDCDDAQAERLRKLLASQVRVLDAVSVDASEAVEREVALIEVVADGSKVRLRLGRHGRVSTYCHDGAEGRVEIEALGHPSAIADLTEDLGTLGPCDVVRSGPLTLRHPGAGRSH